MESDFVVAAQPFAEPNTPSALFGVDFQYEKLPFEVEDNADVRTDFPDQHRSDSAVLGFALPHLRRLSPISLREQLRLVVSQITIRRKFRKSEVLGSDLSHKTPAIEFYRSATTVYVYGLAKVVVHPVHVRYLKPGA